MKLLLILISIIFSVSTWCRCLDFSPCIEFDEKNESNFVRVQSISTEENNNDDFQIINTKETLYNEFLGIPYLYGGETKNGIDCSAFTQQYFKKMGIHLERSSRGQFSQSDLKEVSSEELAINDLLFFREGPDEEISHVAIYIGDGKMIHSSRREGGVAVSDFANSTFWKKRFYKAKRFI